ncbi:MAG: hypothetical protein V1871_01245 [Planctomycetota bacterium]
MKVAVLTPTTGFEVDGFQFCRLQLPRQTTSGYFTEVSKENSVMNYDIFVADIDSINNEYIVEGLNYIANDLFSKILTFGVLIVFSGEDTIKYKTIGRTIIANTYSWIPLFDGGLKIAKSHSARISCSSDRHTLGYDHQKNFNELTALFYSDFYFKELPLVNKDIAIIHSIYLDAGSRTVGILALLKKRWENMILILPKTKNKNQVLKYILSVLLPSISSYFGSEDNIAEPDAEWIKKLKLDIPKVIELHQEISNIEKNIEQLNTKSKEQQILFQDMTKWTDLLTKGGRELEIRVGEAFDFLLELNGNVQHEPNGKDGPDVTFEKDGKHIIVECKSSTGLIKKAEGGQLLGWLDNPDYEGVLVCNTFAKEDINDRITRDYTKNTGEKEPLFSPDLVKLAEKRNFTVIWTKDLYNLVINKLKGEPIDVNNLLNLLTNHGLQKLK